MTDRLSQLSPSTLHTIGSTLGPGHTVVTVAVDTGLKYLTGDLYQA